MSRRALTAIISLLTFLFASQAVLASGTMTRAAPSVPASSKAAAANKKGTSRVKATRAQTRKKAAPARHRIKSAQKSSRIARAKPGKTPRKSQTAQSAPPIVAPSSVGTPSGLSVGELAGLHRTPDPLALRSSVALVVDQGTAEILFEKNADVPLPIASLTKLMTALIVVEARQDLNQVLGITADDIDREKNSASRLRVGVQMTRGEMLQLALMSSENRAASALARYYPGGLPAFVGAMNARARLLGMRDTRFVDSTGLSSSNVASAQDLAKLALAAYRYPLIREYSTNERQAVEAGGHQLHYMNSNRLVRHPDWDIGLQKTGYISEAGRCLLMQTRINERPVVMIFLDSRGKDSRLGDAGRIRRWLESSDSQTMTRISKHHG